MRPRAPRTRVLALALAVLPVSVLPLTTSPTPASAAGTTETNPLAATGDPRPGIYQVWGSDRDAALPYVRGGQIVVQWNVVNPARGRFDWSSLAAKIAAYKAWAAPPPCRSTPT